MIVKSNFVPETYVALCSAKNTDRLVRFNVHLRGKGIDARYLSTSPVGPVIMVPPEKHKEAGQLRDAWLADPTSLLADYAEILRRRPAAEEAG